LIDGKIFICYFMNTLIEIIKQRRSIRRFETKPVEPEKIDLLLQAALLSPSSKNTRSWEFIVVDQPDLLQALSVCRDYGSSFVANAPLVIVVALDPEKNDAWVENGAIASAFLQLQAEALGLGSCWIQVARRPHNETLSAEEYIRQILHIPDSLRILNMVAIGYKAQTLPPHPINETLQVKIHHNRF
jgi:nitroreductase